MDSEDASYYAEKISSLENEQAEFPRPWKGQKPVVKSTLKSMNSTLLSVPENERILSKGLDEMAKHINERDGEIKEIFTGTSMLLTVSEHNMQLERALDECRREYNIRIDASKYSQKGILQPHIITPAQIVKEMKASQADIPSELSLQIPLSATYRNLIVNIIELDIFIGNNILVYMIRLPLTNHVNYVYHVLPLPIKIRDTDTRFTLILPEREYLLMDVAKRYYARLKVNEIKECKLISSQQSLQTIIQCKYDTYTKGVKLKCSCQLGQYRLVVPKESQRSIKLYGRRW